MRYDIFNDVVEILDRDSIFSMPPAPNVTKVDVGKYALVVQKITYEGKSYNAYFSPLVEGPATLFAKMLSLSLPAGNPPHSDRRDPARYEPSGDVYFVK